MQLSAEIRFFWPQSGPKPLHDWFTDATTHGTKPGGGQPRTDIYLREPLQQELGIKLRGGKGGIEVKGLVATLPHATLGNVSAPIELWTKWTSQALVIDARDTIPTTKIRLLRKFSTDADHCIEIPLGPNELPLEADAPLPDTGCNVELTRVAMPASDTWWTLGLEAFGSLDTVERSLRRTIAVLAERHIPDLGAPIIASYPSWLADR